MINNLMLLNELFNPVRDEYQNPGEDGSVYSISDTRKTRLTLAQLNRLRIMNDQRTVEYQKRMEQIKQIYGAAPEAGPSGF
jgi:hypothetical protein